MAAAPEADHRPQMAVAATTPDRPSLATDPGTPRRPVTVSPRRSSRELAREGPGCSGVAPRELTPSPKRPALTLPQRHFDTPAAFSTASNRPPTASTTPCHRPVAAVESIPKPSSPLSK